MRDKGEGVTAGDVHNNLYTIYTVHKRWSMHVPQTAEEPTSTWDLNDMQVGNTVHLTQCLTTTTTTTTDQHRCIPSINRAS